MPKMPPKPPLEPEPLQPTFFRAFVEPRGYWPFSTMWADEVHDKSPRTPFVGLAPATCEARSGRALHLRGSRHPDPRHLRGRQAGEQKRQIPERLFLYHQADRSHRNRDLKDGHRQAHPAALLTGDQCALSSLVALCLQFLCVGLDLVLVLFVFGELRVETFKLSGG